MEVKPGYKQTEVGVIPEEWKVVRLAAACSMKSGEGITSANIDQFSQYPCYGGNGLRGRASRLTHDGSFALIGRQGALCGNVLGVEGQFFASEHAIVVTPSANTDIRWLTYVLGRMNLNQYSESSAQPGLSVSKILNLELALPTTKDEQRAIATALSDVDALLGALDRLIAKKRDLKQAAMQQLLTGQTRLPGFHGEWEVKPFGDVFRKLNAKDHQVQTSEYQANGDFPVVDQGQEAIVGFSDRADKRFRCPGDGVVIFGDHTCIVKFVDFDFVVGADGTQILAAKPGQSARFHFFHLQARGIATTGYNRHFKFLKERGFVSPPLPEQTAIAAVLTEMDAELAVLEQRHAKTRAIKQGMMQELLTGRTRLVVTREATANGRRCCCSTKTRSVS